MLGPSPFALTNPAPAFRALALAAGRAPLGGPRESLMATLVAARLAAGALPESSLTAGQRSTRAEQARSWIGTIAVPQVPKVAASRVIELSAKGDREGLSAALAKVTEVTANYLDRTARSELEALSARLKA